MPDILSQKDQNYTKIPSHPNQIGHHQKQTANASEDARKKDPSCIVDGNVTSVTTMEISMEFHQNTKM
jgi:hypothetical protein